MALLYVDEHHASLNEAAVAGSETLYEGEFIVIDSNGDASRFDPANDDLPHGIIVHHAGPLSDALNLHDEDYTTNYDEVWKFEGSNDDHLYYQPLADVDQIRGRTLTDNGTDPAPSFNEGTVVGIVTINTKTQLVESGYTDNGGTTYSESGAGDFIAIGRVDQYPQEFRIGDTFDKRLPTRLDADIFSTA